MRVTLHRYVRLAEIVLVAVLSVFALLTYRELRVLRKIPVVLPHYEFEVTPNAGHDAVVRTRGTWIAEQGPTEPLQTITIECARVRMECVESAASVVFVGDRGILESTQMVFEVDRWNDTEVHTKPATGACANRVLLLDLNQKRATSHVSASDESARCKQRPERILELVAGYRARPEDYKKEASS